MFTSVLDVTNCIVSVDWADPVNVWFISYEYDTAFLFLVAWLPLIVKNSIPPPPSWYNLPNPSFDFCCEKSCLAVKIES